jgi:hypothetical protein
MPGTYVGVVDGPESGRCVARFQIGVLRSGGVSIDDELQLLLMSG